MTSKDIAKVVKYWRDASTHDLETAKSLFRTGKYDYCLFLCHLSLEKLLKALVTSAIKDHPPFTHNLLYLAGKANLELSKSQIGLLDHINKFNMEARYPEDLRAFYKKANRAYAREYLDITKDFWKWLRKKLEA
ncbi:MAG: HEPN domain-containing protein [Pseudomonadota bacterium]